jgi:PhnB protein
MNYTVTPFLSLAGAGQEALEYYSDHLGAVIVFKVTYKDMKKMDTAFSFSAGKENYISHAIMKIGDSEILLSDDLMDGQSELHIGNNASICIQSDDEGTIRQLYGSLISDKKTKVIVPLAANAFSPAYAIVSDPFGLIIQLNVNKK